MKNTNELVDLREKKERERDGNHKIIMEMKTTSEGIRILINSISQSQQQGTQEVVIKYR